MCVPLRFVIPLNLDFSVSRNERQLTKLRFLAQGVSRFITKLCVKPILKCVLFSWLYKLFSYFALVCTSISWALVNMHAVLFSVPKFVWVFFPSSGTCHYFVIRTPHSLPHGRHNLMISRRTLSESNILTTIKGFGINILPTRASRNLGLLQGLRKVGDLGTVGITIWEMRACQNHAFHREGAGGMSLYGSDTW